MTFKKVLTGVMIGCLLITNVNHMEAKGRLKRALAGTFLGGIAGGAVGFGIGVLSVIGIGACCPCCILIPVIGASVLGVGTGAVSGGVVGAVTAKDSVKTSSKTNKTKKKKRRCSKRDKKKKDKKVNKSEVSEDTLKTQEHCLEIPNL